MKDILEKQKLIITSRLEVKALISVDVASEI